MLDRAHRGPEQGRGSPRSKRDRRVAATTRATSAPTSDAATAPAEATTPAVRDIEPDTRGDEPLAKVIPLGIFDPFTEAHKRW